MDKSVFRASPTSLIWTASLIAGSLCASGCGDILSGAGGATGSTLAESTGLAMTEVEAFALEASATEGTNGLKAVLADGTLVEVPLTEGDEGTISALYDTPQLLVLEAEGYSSNDETCSMVGISKADGSLHCIPYMLFDSYNEVPMIAPVQSDADGSDVYFAGVDSKSLIEGGLMKLSFDGTAEDPVSFTTIAPSAGYFTVNDLGDVILGGTELFSLVAGGTQTAFYSAEPILCMQAGSGGDSSNIYFFAGESAVELHKATKGSGFTDSTIPMTDDAEEPVSGAFVPLCSSGSLSSIGGAVFAAGAWTASTEGAGAEARILKIAAGTAQASEVGDFSTLMKIHGAGANLYVAGANSGGQSLLARTAPSTLTPTALIAAGVYAITDMHANAEETLFFAGTKDGAPVLGKVAASGTTAVEIAPGTEIAKVISVVPAEADEAAD